MKLPRDIGPVHFVGIGGIGMSGIAEVLVNLGYTVQGSDMADNANVQRLRAKGVTVHIGHAAANLGGAKVIVVSSAMMVTSCPAVPDSLTSCRAFSRSGADQTLPGLSV